MASMDDSRFGVESPPVRGCSGPETILARRDGEDTVDPVGWALPSVPHGGGRAETKKSRPTETARWDPL